jgi:hypothetical protein
MATKLYASAGLHWRPFVMSRLLTQTSSGAGNKEDDARKRKGVRQPYAALRGTQKGRHGNAGRPEKELGTSLAWDRVTSDTILAFTGNDGESTLLAESAGQETADRMRLPTGNLGDLGQTRAARLLQQFQHSRELGSSAGGGRRRAWFGFPCASGSLLALFGLAAGLAPSGRARRCRCRAAPAARSLLCLFPFAAGRFCGFWCHGTHVPCVPFLKLASVACP